MSIPSFQHSPGPDRSHLVLNRSMLSDSESDDDGDVNEGAPPVELSPSQGDESYARWQRRFECEMELECRREILLLRASLESANRRLAAVGEGAQDKGAPFASDIEPIANLGDDDGVFLRIADDLENNNDGGQDVGRDSDGAATVSLTDPALEKELEGYRAALIESLGLSADAALVTAPSSDSSERQKVNVKLLNAEDYVTDWTETVSARGPSSSRFRVRLWQT